MALMGEDLPSPDVPEHFLWLWRAWHRLSLDRPWIGGGMAPSVPGRIAWRDVVQWCEWHGREAWEVEMASRVFADMDRVYIAWHMDNIPKSGG